MSLFAQELGDLDGIGGSAQCTVQPFSVVCLLYQIVGKHRPLIGKHMLRAELRSVKLTIEGQVMGNDINAMGKGLYIVNGKKVMK